MESNASQDSPVLNVNEAAAAAGCPFHGGALKQSAGAGTRNRD